MGDNTGYVYVYKKTNATHFTAHQVRTRHHHQQSDSAIRQERQRQRPRSDRRPLVLVGAIGDRRRTAHLYKLDGTLVKSFVAPAASSAYFGSAVGCLAISSL